MLVGVPGCILKTDFPFRHHRTAFVVVLIQRQRLLIMLHKLGEAEQGGAVTILKDVTTLRRGFSSSEEGTYRVSSGSAFSSAPRNRVRKQKRSMLRGGPAECPSPGKLKQPYILLPYMRKGLTACPEEAPSRRAP